MVVRMKIFVVLLLLVVVDSKHVELNDTETGAAPSHVLGPGSIFITKGVPASARNQPFLVGILVHIPHRRLSICGASMLSNTRSVTAAHCWRGVNYQAEYFTLAFGANNIYTDGTRINTTDVEIHAHYNMRNFNNDIAMIKHEHVEYSDTIQPIALPSDDFLNNDFAGWWATAVGFGATSDDYSGQENENRYMVLIQVISNDVCARSFKSLVLNSTLCIDTTGGHSTCSGDSGGPLYTQINGQLALIGITSFGLSADCEKGDPEAFSRVTSYVPWIRERL